MDVSTLLEGIFQLIVEDKASRDGISINLRHAALIEQPLVQKYIVENYKDFIQSESLYLLENINNESKYCDENFINRVIEFIMKPENKLFADLMIYEYRIINLMNLMNKILYCAIYTDNSSLVKFILNRYKCIKDEILDDDTVCYLNRPRYSNSDFGGKSELSILVCAGIYHSINVIDTIVLKIRDYSSRFCSNEMFMYQGNPSINILTMSLMYNHPDRDKADRERLKTETVNRALLLSLNDLWSSDYRGLDRCPDNLLSGTIKFLLSSDDRNVSFPDLPKNAELLQKSEALEYLIEALKKYPKSRISKGWLNGIKCAIDHEHVELFKALLNIAINDEKNARKIKKAYNYLKTKNNPEMIAYIEERVCFIDNSKPLPL